MFIEDNKIQVCAHDHLLLGLVRSGVTFSTEAPGLFEQRENHLFLSDGCGRTNSISNPRVHRAAVATALPRSAVMTIDREALMTQTDSQRVWQFHCPRASVLQRELSRCRSVRLADILNRTPPLRITDIAGRACSVAIPGRRRMLRRQTPRERGVPKPLPLIRSHRRFI